MNAHGIFWTQTGLVEPEVNYFTDSVTMVLVFYGGIPLQVTEVCHASNRRKQLTGLYIVLQVYVCYGRNCAYPEFVR
jgi:hypothetical protein